MADCVELNLITNDSDFVISIDNNKNIKVERRIRKKEEKDKEKPSSKKELKKLQTLEDLENFEGTDEEKINIDIKDKEFSYSIKFMGVDIQLMKDGKLSDFSEIKDKLNNHFKFNNKEEVENLINDIKKELNSLIKGASNEMEETLLKAFMKSLINELDGIKKAYDTLSTIDLDNRLLYNYLYNTSDDGLRFFTTPVVTNVKISLSTLKKLNKEKEFLNKIKDTFEYLSTEYKENVLGITDREFNKARVEELKYALSIAKQDINTTFNIVSKDIKQLSKDTQAIYMSYKDSINASINNVINNINKLVEQGFIFDNELYSSVFTLRDSTKLVDMSISLSNVLDKFTKNFSNILGELDEQMTKAHERSLIIPSATKGVSLSDKLNRIFNSQSITEENFKDYLNDIETLIKIYEDNNFDLILGEVMNLYDTINNLDNLYESLMNNDILNHLEKSRLEDSDDIFAKELKDMYTTQKSLLDRLRNANKDSINRIDRVLINNISNYVTRINNLKFNLMRLKIMKAEKNEEITASDVYKIIRYSDYKSIFNDIDIIDLEGTTFNQTEVEQISGLKVLIDMKVFELKRKNEEDIKRIFNKYNYFEEKFGGKEELRQAMNLLFERVNGVRNGFLISKYDKSELIHNEDRYRKTGLNNEFIRYADYIYNNTSYKNAVDKILNEDKAGIEFLLGIKMFNEYSGLNLLERRDVLFEQFIKKFSNINFEGSSNLPLSSNKVFELSNYNITIKEYLENIKYNLDNYINYKRGILDDNGERVFSDEYLDELAEFYNNNYKRLYSYFKNTYDIQTIEIGNITLNDFSKIVNSFLTIHDRYDAFGNLAYMYNEYNSIVNRANNAFDYGQRLRILNDECKFNKLYKFNIGHNRNRIRYKEKKYSKDYEEYLKSHSNKMLLEELYDYVYNELKELNSDLDIVNQYSNFDTKLFAFQSEKSLQEKFETRGAKGLMRDSLNDFFKTAASSSHKFYLNKNTSILIPRRTTSLSITEENLSNNIFSNLMNAIIDKNKYEGMVDLMGQAKASILALEQISVNTGSGINILKNLPKKIKNKIETMYGIKQIFFFEKPVVSLTEEGALKIQKKYAKDKGYLNLYNNFLDTMNSKSINSTYEYIAYTGNLLKERFGINIDIRNKYKQNINTIDLKDFFKNAIDYYEDLKSNNRESYKYFEKVNNYTKHLIYHFIDNNIGLKTAIRDYLDDKGIKDYEIIYLSNLNCIDFYKLMYEVLENYIKYDVNVSENGIYNLSNIEQRSNLVKRFFTKAYYIDKKGRRYDIENTRIESTQKNASDSDVNSNFLNLNFLDLTIDTLDKLTLNTMSTISYTEAIELDKVMEMEKVRTVENYKVISTDKVIETVTNLSASQALDLSVLTFIGEMSYGFMGLINRAFTSPIFSSLDVASGMVNGLFHTTFGSLSTNKKIERIKSLLNRDEFFSLIPSNSEYYKRIKDDGTIDLLNKGYNNFKHLLGTLPNKFYRNVVMDMVCKKFYVTIIDADGKEQKVNILDCFDEEGNQIYKISDYDLVRFINMFDDTLRDVVLYNNDHIEINRHSWKKAMLLFKTFFINMFKLYFESSKSLLYTDEMRRGIFLSFLGKNSLFFNKTGNIDLMSVIPKLLLVITNGNHEGSFMHKSDIHNIRRAFFHTFLISVLYCILGAIETEVYDEDEVYVETEEGNYVKQRRRRRKRVKANSLDGLYTIMARIYRENVMMYDGDNTLGFLGDYGIPQFKYVSNFLELINHLYSQEVYTTGIYKGKYKWEVDFMQTNYIGTFMLRMENFGKNAKIQH